MNEKKVSGNEHPEKKRFLCMLLFCCFAVTVFVMNLHAENNLGNNNTLSVNQQGQLIKISGTVTDETDEPLPGVNVTIICIRQLDQIVVGYILNSATMIKTL
jgi:hypothetical protein